MMKTPDDFNLRVFIEGRRWIVTDSMSQGCGRGLSPAEAIRNYAEGLEVGLRINQRIEMQDTKGNA